MSDNQDNNQDSNNNNQENQPSKLQRPSSLDHYFNKIEANPKLFQFQAKIKPNRFDKNTKFSFKTNQKQLWSSKWMNNARLKFEAKQGKTKLSVSTKMLESELRDDRYYRMKKYQNQGLGKQYKTIQQMINDEAQYQPRKLASKSNNNQQQDSKNNQNKSKDNNSGDFDMSLSTAFDNSKINIRLKDKGQINLKFNQMVQIIPNSLKAQAQYLYQYKNKKDIFKYGLQFLYTTGLNRYIDQFIIQPILNTNNIINQNNTKQVSVLNSNLLKKYRYQKNQTKIKAKFTNHSDTQFKVNSINHFGQLKQAPSDSQNGLKGQFKDNVIAGKNLINQIVDTIKNVSQDDGEQKPEKTPKDPNQILKVKLELQNKLTLSSKSSQQFNFKTTLNCQSVPYKQSIKFETIVNQNGFHNFESRYLCKSIPTYIFGALFSINWNAHSSYWHRKWQLLFEKQKLFNNISLGLSVNDKCLGFKFIKKFGKYYKIELMSSRKWQGGSNSWGNIGVKININW